MFRVVAAADQRGRKDEGDAQFPPLLGIAFEDVGMDVALHWVVLLGRAHVLPDGHDVASRGGEIGQYAVHFLIRFPKPDHQAALADAPGFLDAAQELKALLIVGLRPDAAVMRGRGFHIVVDDVGLGVHDGSQGLAAAAKIGDEHFDGGAGFAAVPDSPDGCREVGRSAVRQVVPRHGRHHGMAQAEGRRCLAHAGGLFGVGRVDDAAADVAEGTVAGAGVAEDEERGGLA